MHTEHPMLDAMQHIGGRIKLKSEAAGKTAQGAQKAMGDLADKGRAAKDTVMDTLEDAIGKTPRQAAGKTAQGAQRAMGDLADKGRAAKDTVVDTLEDAIGKTPRQAAGKTAQGAQRAMEDLADKGRAAKDTVVDALEDVAGKIQHQASNVKTAVEENAAEAGNAVTDTYDMLKDGMDMTGIADAKAKLADAGAKVASRVKQGVQGTEMPLRGLQGVAAYEMLEQMEQAEDHPAELENLRSAEQSMYGDDHDMRGAAATWPHSPPKTTGKRASTDFDGEAMSALLDEVEDYGATINANEQEMARQGGKRV
ncbi:hypothetical protein THASP1DRAFT_28335 [Thamnocephalis sphaerospora]|uniref:Uncharacterized protein n=1 Tax=Thamnocephalis sphaerospora TaxID=78915 RepID=A0A4P9XUI8_9FUNG|nr:hypothetical protein THASP1DRAFT_28335 [Thamnocephalis sphaerospora]|eukprot:RKP09876.1 hypothetical protein THASP1DRAFT_28335 [Thamnocephalis sphaerospora]